MIDSWRELRCGFAKVISASCRANCVLLAISVAMLSFMGCSNEEQGFDEGTTSRAAKPTDAQGPPKITKIILPPGWKSQERLVKVAVPGKKLEKKIVYYTNTIGMDFVYLHPGVFKMGGEKRDAKPVHSVSISKPFLIGSCEVTSGQYQQHVPNHFCYPDLSRVTFESSAGVRPPDQETLGELPVVDVSWGEAISFCKWLSKKEGLKYRLPTEAEWEYACRAGSGTRFYWGETLEDDCAWHPGNAPSWPQPVGTNIANAFGLYDMSGNVEEWCQSLFKRYPYQAGDGREEISARGLRVCRGSDYVAGGYMLGSGERCFAHRSFTNSDRGFRVIVELDALVGSTGSSPGKRVSPPAEK